MRLRQLSALLAVAFSAAHGQGFTILAPPSAYFEFEQGWPILSAVRDYTFRVSPVTADVTPPYVWTVTGAPPGFTFRNPPNPVGTGTVTGWYEMRGAATQSGNYSATFRVTDAAGRSATLTVPMRVYPALRVITTQLPQAEEGVPYDAEVAFEGGIPPVNAACQVAAGFTCVQNGEKFAVRGRPGTETGCCDRVVRNFVTLGLTYPGRVASGGAQQTVGSSLDLSVRRGVHVTDTQLPGARTNSAYSHQMTVVRGSSPYRFALLGQAPPGLTLSAGGLLSGRPTQNGDYQIRFTVTDANGTVYTGALTLRVANGFRITTTAVPEATVGQAYSFAAESINARGPVRWTALGLPAGLTISAGGVISGTPQGPPGAFTVKLGATDGDLVDSVDVSLLVKAAPGQNPNPAPTPEITTRELPDAIRGREYRQQVTSNVEGAAYSASGLPAGLGISPQGLIAGVPAGSLGTYLVLLEAANQLGVRASVSLSLRLRDPEDPGLPAPPVRLTTASPLPDLKLGEFITSQFSAADGKPPYRFSAPILDLPAGMTLNPNGSYIGTPTREGTFNFRVTVTDSEGGVDERAYRQTVTAGASSPTPQQRQDLPTATAGKPYVYRFTDRVIELRNMPPGATFDAATGVFSWTAPVPGVVDMTALIGGGLGSTPVERPVRLVVEAGVAPPVAPLRLVSADGAGLGRIQLTIPPLSGPVTIWGRLTGSPCSAGVRVTVAPEEGVRSPFRPAIPIGDRLELTTEGNLPPGVTFRGLVRVECPGMPTLAIPYEVQNSQRTPWISSLDGPLHFLGTDPVEGGHAVFFVDPPPGARSVRAVFRPNPGTPAFAVSVVQLDTGRLFVSIRSGSAPPGVYSGVVELEDAVAGRREFPIDLVRSTNSGLAITGYEFADRTQLELDVSTTFEVSVPPSAIVGGTPLTDPLMVGSHYRFSLPSALVPAEAEVSLDHQGTVLITRAHLGRPALLRVPEIVNRRFTVRNLTGGPLRLRIHAPGISPLPVPFFDMVVESGQAEVELPADFAEQLQVGDRLTVQAGEIGSSVLNYVGGDAPITPSAGKESRRAGACPSSGLRVFLTQPESLTTLTAGVPRILRAWVLDRCGAPIEGASVSAYFGNGDRSVRLMDTGSGRYAANWTPLRAGVGAHLEVRASLGTMFEAVSSIFSVAPNPGFPILDHSGIVSGASFEGGRARAPGEFVSLFGLNLAGGTAVASGTPLPASLGGVTLTFNGKPVPLLSVSPGQINAILPFGIPVNTELHLMLNRGGARLGPIRMVTAEAQPAVFSRDQSGKGQGVILDAQFRFYDSGNPARAGDPFVIYCSGLGEVDPAATAGVAASTTTLHRTKLPVRVTVGGVEAAVAFAGLAPGLAGVYQINGVVPAGVAAGVSVPVVVQAGGQVSPPVTIAVR